MTVQHVPDDPAGCPLCTAAEGWTGKRECPYHPDGKPLPPFVGFRKQVAFADETTSYEVRVHAADRTYLLGRVTQRRRDRFCFWQAWRDVPAGHPSGGYLTWKDGTVRQFRLRREAADALVARWQEDRAARREEGATV